MKNPKLWYISTSSGCGIRNYETRSINKARKCAIHENGTNNFISIKEATEDDISWVEGMGGYIPKIARNK